MNPLDTDAVNEVPHDRREGPPAAEPAADRQCWNYANQFFTVGPNIANHIEPEGAFCACAGDLVFKIAEDCDWEVILASVEFVNLLGETIDWPTAEFGLPQQATAFNGFVLPNHCRSPKLYSLRFNIDTSGAAVMPIDPSIDNEPKTVDAD